MAKVDSAFSAHQQIQFADHGVDDFEEGDFPAGTEPAIDDSSVVLAEEVGRCIDVPLVLAVKDFRQSAVEGLQERAPVICGFELLVDVWVEHCDELFEEDGGLVFDEEGVELTLLGGLLVVEQEEEAVARDRELGLQWIG